MLGAVGDLVGGAGVALAPLLGAVGVLDRHPHDRDRVVDAGDRRHARDAAAGADDHLAVDLLAEDAVRRADVVGALGRDRRGLDAEAGRAHRDGGLVDDGVVRRPAVLEREVEVLELERQTRHLRVEHADGLVEQLLAGLVTFEDRDLQRLGHAADDSPRGRSGNLSARRHATAW